jgi:anti-sigma factor RsiW
MGKSWERRMTCREFEADIVELARGTEADAAAAERLRAHLERCAECAARLERERRLTAALKAMASAEPPSARAAVIEAELLAAFAGQRSSSERQSPAPRTRSMAPAVRMGLAAAAVLVLAVAAWQGAARWTSPEDTVGGSGAGPARLAARPEARPVPAGGGQALQFVALPTAIGLPALESGRIVRVQFPAAELPAYGFDVSPQPAAGAVEADLLVGQDGQPRAIRFVTLEADSRRPQ